MTTKITDCGFQKPAERVDPFEIPNILESLKADIENKKISIREAAEELHAAGWTNCIDEDKAKTLLKVEENSMAKEKKCYFCETSENVRECLYVHESVNGKHVPVQVHVCKECKNQYEATFPKH